MIVCCVQAAVTMLVRYRQVAEYVSTAGDKPPQSPHACHINKVSLGIGGLITFGITLVANFQVRESVYCQPNVFLCRCLSRLALSTCCFSYICLVSAKITLICRNLIFNSTDKQSAVASTTAVMNLPQWPYAAKPRSKSRPNVMRYTHVILK